MAKNPLVPVGRYEGTSSPGWDGADFVIIYSRRGGTLRIEFGDGHEDFANVTVSENGTYSVGSWTYARESGPCVFDVVYRDGTLALSGWYPSERMPGKKPVPWVIRATPVESDEEDPSSTVTGELGV